jgi:hypothetical protein
MSRTPRNQWLCVDELSTRGDVDALLGELSGRLLAQLAEKHRMRLV